MIVCSVSALFASPWISPGGLGIQGGESVTSIEKDSRGNIVKRTFKIEEGRTLWDWFGLLGVPLTLAVLGYILQKLQQEKAIADAELQREKAQEAAKEEVLQVYYDRLSAPLLEKVLLALPAKKDQTEQEVQLVESAKHVFRARTLSVLRRLSDDPGRKESVIRFLIESYILSKLKVNLSGADLSRTDLSFADLDRAILHKAIFRKANLHKTILHNAILIGADLSDTDLSWANLMDANLKSAILHNATLNGANLFGANLSYADLMGVTWDEATAWPAPSHFENAVNIPEAIRIKLGF